MKTESWSGLITNASPYALPLGAAVEQVNFHNTTPGQLESRGGMRRVSFVGGAPGSLDCFSANFNGKSVLLSLADDGIYALASPALGPSSGPAIVPEPSEELSTAETTYLWDYAGYGDIVHYPAVIQPGGDGDGDVGDPPIQDPEDDFAVFAIDGGSSGSEYAYVINANEQCEGDERISEFFGGRSTTVLYPRTFRDDQLCPFLPVDYDHIATEQGDFIAISNGSRLIV